MGTRHKHAVIVMNSLHDSVLLLICDGYGDPQLAASKVSQGHKLQSQGHKVVTSKASQGHGLVVQGRDMVPDKVSQGRELQFQGHEVITKKASQGHGIVVQGHDVVPDKVSQDRAQDHEMASDNVVQGHGLAFQGHEKMNGVSERTADEQRRERGRQRRLARYGVVHLATSFYCVPPITPTWPRLNSNVGLEEGEY